MVVCSLMLLLSCNRREQFAFDDIVYVSDFPMEIEPESYENIGIETIGSHGLKVLDDYILISCHDTMGCLSVYSKDIECRYPPFLRIGRGPGEVLYQPFVSWLDFDVQDGTYNVGLFDYKGNYLVYDLVESLKLGYGTWDVVADSLSLASGARYFKIAGDTLLCRRWNVDATGFERFMLSGHKKEYFNRAMVKLNSVNVSDANLLATSIVVNQDKQMIVEFGSLMNVIHLYSYDNDFQRTLVIGESITDVNELEREDGYERRKMFYDAKVYESFFAGLHIGCTIEELDKGAFGPPVIYLFKWNGTPLAKIKLPVRALYFDIDVKQRELYVIDYDTEKVIKFPMEHSLVFD